MSEHHQDASAVVAAWQDALNRRDHMRVLELSDERIEIVGPRGIARGHDLLLQWLENTRVELHPQRTFARGEMVVVAQRGVWRDPQIGTLIGEAQVASVFRVRDGRVRSYARFDMLLDALEHAGLVDLGGEAVIAQRLQHYIEYAISARGQHEFIDLPGLNVYIHGEETSAEENLILPQPALSGDIAAQVERAFATCAQRGRQAQVLFISKAAPALREALDDAGYICHLAEPVLIANLPLPEEDLESSPLPVIQGEEDRLTLDILDQHSSIADLQANLDVNALGFDPQAARSTEQEAEGYRGGLTNCRSFTLRLNGEPVSAGMYLPVVKGVSELVGIATLEQYRRRGFGRTLTAAMAEAAGEAGADLVFLVAASPEAANVYLQAGFTLWGERLVYRRAE